MVSKEGSYIGGSTVVRVYQSDKRLSERQVHWRRERGIDRIDQCVQGVGDVMENVRLIKDGDPGLRPQWTKRSRRAGDQSKSAGHITAPVVFLRVHIYRTSKIDEVARKRLCHAREMD